MTARVRIPTQLRSLTEGRSEVDAGGVSVGDLIGDLDTRYPGFGERILQEGKLRRFVNVYVGDEDVRFLEGLATEVPENALVSIIPAVAGGARKEAG